MAKNNGNDTNPFMAVAKSGVKPEGDISQVQTVIPFDEDEKKLMADQGATPTDQSKLVPTKEGLTTVGQAVIKPLMNDAKSKEDVDLAAATAKMAQAEADLNAELANELKRGQVLSERVGFDRYGERKLEPAIDDFGMDLFMYDADDKARMIAELKERNRKKGTSVTSPVLQKLGLHDYYPDIDKGIGVGSISSQMLGSRTRYVAQGGLVPWGIVDERRRAIDAELKKKAELANQIKTQRFVADTQYQQMYDDYYLDKQNEFFDMAGDDITVLTDPTTEVGREYRKFMTRMENVYKENAEMGEVVDSIMKKHEEGDFVPDSVLNLIDNWNTARLDVDSYIKGGKKLSSLVDQLKSYESTRTWLDEKAKELESEKDVMPLKAGVDFSDPKVAKNAMDAIKRTNYRDYDEMRQAIRTYYDTDKMDAIIEGAYGMSSRFYKGQSPEELEKLKLQAFQYLMGSLGEKIDVESSTVSTKALDWEKFAYKKQKDQTFYTNNDLKTQEIGVQIQRINENKDLTEKQRKQQVQQLMASQANYDADVSKRLGFSTTGIPLSANELKKRNQMTTGDIIVRIGGKNVPLRQLVASNGSEYSGKDKELYDQWKNFAGEIDRRGGSINAIPAKRATAPYTTYTDPVTGKVRMAPSEYMDPKGKPQTLIIDQHFEFEYSEPVQKWSETETESITDQGKKSTSKKIATSGAGTVEEKEIVKAPGDFYFYQNGSDMNVTSELDAVDKELSIQTGKAYSHRGKK